MLNYKSVELNALYIMYMFCCWSRSFSCDNPCRVFNVLLCLTIFCHWHRIVYATCHNSNHENAARIKIISTVQYRRANFVRLEGDTQIQTRILSSSLDWYLFYKNTQPPVSNSSTWFVHVVLPFDNFLLHSFMLAD